MSNKTSKERSKGRIDTFNDSRSIQRIMFRYNGGRSAAEKTTRRKVVGPKSQEKRRRAVGISSKAEIYIYIIHIFDWIILDGFPV